MVSAIMKQTWVVLGVLFNDLAQGMVLSFSSIMVPALLASDSDIKVDVDVASWIASVIGLGGMIGFVISAFVMELYGRKFAYIIFLIFGVFGWLCIYFSTNVTVLIIGRLFGGICSSSTNCIGSIVIGEYTNPRNRGMFLNLKAAALCCGNLIVHLLGHFLNWRTVVFIAIAATIAAFLIVCTWPESPSWFASVKKFQDCERSFYWLRGKNVDSVQELKELLRAQKERLENKPISTTYSFIIVEFFKKFTKKDFIKPVFIILLCGILLEASGAHFFPAYALQFVEEVTGTKGNTVYYTLGLDLIISFSMIFSSFLVKCFKRRTLLFGSGFLSLIVLYSVSLYIFLATKDVISKERTYIPIILFGIYLMLSSFGCFTVTISLLGEIFPLPHKGTAISVSCVFLALFLMSGMQIIPYLLAGLKVYGTFALTGTVMLILLIALWFLLPETKDRTLQEIEDYFIQGNYSLVECKTNVYSE